MVLAVGLVAGCLSGHPWRDFNSLVPLLRSEVDWTDPSRFAFEIRTKAPAAQKAWWNNAFFVGSAMTSLAQGFMLGLCNMGLWMTVQTLVFATITAVVLSVGYCLIGACWLVLKTDGALRKKATSWAGNAKWDALFGIGAVSIATPLVSPRTFNK